MKNIKYLFKNMDLSKLRDVCLHYKDAAPEYYIDPIPEKKINNARESLNIPFDVEIFALIDLTVFGSAKNALTVTVNGLYWKSIDDWHPVFLSWEKLRECYISEKPGMLSKLIYIGSDLQIDLSGAGSLNKKYNKIVMSLLSDLKALSEGNLTEEVLSENSDQSSNGLVECEFCSGMIKPEVTYCKHCGIKLRG